MKAKYSTSVHYLPFFGSKRHWRIKTCYIPEFMFHFYCDYFVAKPTERQIRKHKKWFHENWK